MHRRTFILSTLGVATLLGGCANDPTRGYSFVPTTGGDAKTITINTFDNYTFSKGAEIEVTEAVIKEIQRTTGLRVTRGAADTTLTGVVRTVDMRRVGRDSLTGLADELSMKVVVDFEWKDNRSGSVIVGRKNFSAVDTFVPAQGTGEPIEVGRRAASQRLARDLVAELRSAW